MHVCVKTGNSYSLRGGRGGERVSAIPCSRRSNPQNNSVFAVDVYIAGWYGIPSGMMVAVPVRFECPGQWQFVSDVELTTDQSLKLKRIVTVQNIIHVMYRPSVLLHNCISL